MRHVVVCYEKGKFNGWPANGGIWTWGNEILVSFNHGEYHFSDTTHSIDLEKPMSIAFSRSLDGGETWKTEYFPMLYRRPVQPVPDGGFDFSNPDFVLRVGKPAVAIEGDTFVISYDRGHTWEGPYMFPDLGYPLTTRTRYRILGPKQLDLYASWKDPSLAGMSYQDQSFLLRTMDGGVTWRKYANMTDADARAAMPDVAVLPDGTLAAALRRKTDRFADQYSGVRIEDNWIEVVRSTDGGLHWFPAARRAGETAGKEGRNGNPPAMACLPEGKLVLVYGYRGHHPAIKARVSEDGGFTWKKEIILRDDPLSYDIGYPRLAVRPDGSLVAVYYYTSGKMPEQHIEATIFSLS